MSNTKIQIRRSSVTATPTNGSLSAGELAYSYNSDRLFIGTANSANVQEIGGTYWINTINAAFNAANNVSTQIAPAFGHANAAFDKANLSAEIANSAANSANAYTVTVGAAGNSYAVQIGAAANLWANTVATAGNNYTISVGAASNAWANTVGVNTSAIANAAANAANAYTSATYYLKSGGTISGDVTVTGNLIVSGQTTYTNTNTLLVGDNIITLNADIPNDAAPSENAGIEVNRGSANANSALFWNESVDKWQLSSNIQLGSTYVNIATNTDIEGVSAGANAYAVAVGQAGNNYTDAVGVAGNNYAIQVGAASNTWANNVGTAGNNYSIQVGAASNTWANTVGTAGNNYTNQVGAASNTWANTVGTAGNNYTNSVGAAGNAYAELLTSYANTNAANASYLSTGTVVVARGGTGLNTLTLNGVLYGNGANAVQVTAAGTEGQVLQAGVTGIPSFGMLDGGSF